MKKLFVVFLLLVICCEADAQTKPAFRSQNYIGFLEGNKGSAFQFNTINGLQWGTWFGGIGTGLDWYKFRSVPLFLSINKNLSKASSTFFLSFDGGSNFVWEKRDPSYPDQFYDSEFFPRLFWGAGIGYKAGLKNKKDAILIHLGYSYKQMHEKQTIPTYCINPPCPVTYEYYDYKTNRLSVRFGWMF